MNNLIKEKLKEAHSAIDNKILNMAMRFLNDKVFMKNNYSDMDSKQEIMNEIVVEIVDDFIKLNCGGK